MEARRWDGDERGAGNAPAKPFAPSVAALTAQLHDEESVAEDPQAHLLPHIVRACEASGGLAIAATSLRDDAFAEASTHIAQRTLDETVEYDVVSGMLHEQPDVRTHRHLVRFRVRRVAPG